MGKWYKLVMMPSILNHSPSIVAVVNMHQVSFFECLGMTQHGYQVNSYIHATYNINLPNIFQRSLRPDAWSHTANWIGYIAVSNDEMSAHLGRRDITIAWRGTKTKLEWIADFMYFLRPITLKKIPCPDPRVKVESGFLNLRMRT